jgi:hypothetical protein
MATESDDAGIAFFETKIRPVLVERCYECHSADAEGADKLAGKLLLDTREGARRGGETGPAVVPEQIGESLLISAIRHEDFKMPPTGKLPPEVIADFTKWIEMGAPDPREGAALPFPDSTLDIEAGREFWSFQPLRETHVPQVQNETWARTDVDRYILARQEATGITPNQIADRHTLIRRTFYDLLGLPPTRAEVAAFADDTAPDAYQRLLDRLLDSPHYGERWARHWLDLARFAESNGYAFDHDRPDAFHYRDFVIRALNDDMPYDEFLRLQIAGDLLRPDDFMGVAATGFLVAGPFTTQQSVKERERSRYEQLDDMLATLGTTTLGLTLGCTRCHDHKYDPIPSYDYYRMISTFSEVGNAAVGLDLDPENYKRAKALFDEAHAPIVEARTRYEQDQLPERLAEWIANLPAETVPLKTSDWHWIGPFKGDSFDNAFDQAFVPETTIDLAQDVGELRWKAESDWKDGVVYNTLRTIQGDNSANYLYRTIEVDTPMPWDVSLGFDDAIRVWLNGQLVRAHNVMGGASPDQDRLTLNLRAGRNTLLMKIVNGGGTSGFYFKTVAVGPPENIREILDLAADQRSDEKKQEALNWFRPFDVEWGKLNNAVAAHDNHAPRQYTNVFCAQNGGATYEFGDDTRKVYFLVRGNSNNKQGQAPPGFLQVLNSSPDGESRWTVDTASNPPRQLEPRVAMARWLTDTEYGAGHLLARVIVNRLWQHHFGRGIVSTPSDFGLQGERPTHPELLDYLAQELISNGWSLKAIHRLIMSSSVYMQSGHATAENRQTDPGNLLIWWRSARRLEAEVIRDALLAVSGRLDERMYGRGSLSQEDNRRSIYLTVKRSELIPILQLFDAPDAMQSIGERSTTTVSPQALAMLNSTFVRGLAERFAGRVRPDANTSLAVVVNAAYWTALSRAPTDDEREQMLRWITEQAASYGNDGPATETAVVDFCQLMLCLNEFVYVD